MRVVIVESNKAVYEGETSGSFMDMFHIVGGYPLKLCPYEDEPIAIVCNGDIQDGELPWIGRFIVCGITEDGCVDSLTEEQVRWAMDEFAVYPLNENEDEEQENQA